MWQTLLAQAGNLEPLGEGYGWALFKVLGALLLVCLLAVVLLRLLKRAMGARAGGGGNLRVVDHLPLTARQGLWVVEASGRYFLLAGGDSGMTRLAELDAGDIRQPLPGEPAGGFGDLLEKLAKRRAEDRSG